jgi:predicted nucleotidyltransferase
MEFKMKYQPNEILRVLVGSRAHGLHTEESDYDWRGVFVTPTSEILKIGGHTQQTNWIEGKEDDTSWEIGKFLLMATKCNPTILEAFKASHHSADDISREAYNQYGKHLQALFPHVWNSTDVFNAFRGYAKNQQKKFLDGKDTRPHKYAVAYLRTLYLAVQLLETGTFDLNMEKTPIFASLLRWKNKDYTIGEVMDLTASWEQKVEEAYKRNPNKKTDLAPINQFLLDIRKEFWL